VRKRPRQEKPVEGEGNDAEYNDAEGIVADRGERSERTANARPARDLPPLAPAAVRMESLRTWVADVSMLRIWLSGSGFRLGA